MVYHDLVYWELTKMCRPVIVWLLSDKRHGRFTWN